MNQLGFTVLVQFSFSAGAVFKGKAVKKRSAEEPKSPAGGGDQKQRCKTECSLKMRKSYGNIFYSAPAPRNLQTKLFPITT